MSFEELKKKIDRLQVKKNEIMDKCVKENKTFVEFTEEVGPIANEIYEMEQQMRLIQPPTMEYGKEWKGSTYTIEEFIEMCKNNEIIDDMGYAYYATDNAKSDIKLYIADILDNVYRKDFTHVIWFETIE